MVGRGSWSVKVTFREIAAITVDDGIVFEPGNVIAREIRKEAGYGGVRVVLNSELARACCNVQVDIGFGDAVHRRHCWRSTRCSSRIWQRHGCGPIWSTPSWPRSSTPSRCWA
jgi:hypothetical protein